MEIKKERDGVTENICSKNTYDWLAELFYILYYSLSKIFDQ